jgi:GTPase SAR1 family protein
MAISKELFDIYQIARGQGWLDHLYALVKGNHKILIVGATGVGKTSLSKALASLTNEVIAADDRTVFPSEHKIKIGNKFLSIMDTPGQRQFGTSRRQSYRQFLEQDFCGLINVVADGYHEYDKGGQVRAQAIDRNGKAAPAFLEGHRRSELEQVAEWASSLRLNLKTRWMITVVNKADLWWHERERVLFHYEQGSYKTALDTAGINPRTSVVLPFCATIHKFFDTAPTSGYLDVKDQTEQHGRLIKVLLEAVGKGVGNG